MISFYLLWTGCYLGCLYWMASKWPKQTPKLDFIEELPPVTLLIPVRNERENLKTLFSEIKKLDYPQLQVLLIDDQSEDGSLSLMNEKASKDPRITVLQNPGAGKKSALEFGVAYASGTLILCSDADCRFPKGWERKMVAQFSDPRVQLVCGPVLSAEQHTFFQRFQQIEWASVLLVTQFFFSRRQPLMCSGANLAYRKSAFVKVRGYDQNRQYLSGDDEFLLKKVVAEFGGESCVYLPFPDSLVLTRPQQDLSQLLKQRVRWAGKWKVHRDASHAFAAAASFFTQVCWLGSGLLLGMGTSGILVFLTVWTGKILGERRVLGRVLNELRFHVSLADSAKVGLVHPFYVLTVGVGALWGKFEWKGRSN
jgi:biofilm PGA synthesis N-glycosyltransferase PgaC